MPRTARVSHKYRAAFLLTAVLAFISFPHSSHAQEPQCVGYETVTDGSSCGPSTAVGTNNKVCRVGSRCINNVCSPAKALYDECSVDIECTGFPGRAICYDGRCQLLLSGGDACVSARQCQGQLCENGQCSGISLANACTASEASNPCAPGLYCNAGVCRSQGQKGNSCDPQALDPCSASLVCSPKDQDCREGFSRLEGSPCDSGRDCVFGLTCKDFKCQAISEGSECLSGADCNPGTQQCRCSTTSAKGTCTNVLNANCADQFSSLYQCARNAGCELSDFEAAVTGIVEQPGACLNLNCQPAFEDFACCANADEDLHKMPNRIDCSRSNNNTLMIVIIVVCAMVGLTLLILIIVFVMWKRYETRGNPINLEEMEGLEKTTIKTNYFGHDIEYDAYITKD